MDEKQFDALRNWYTEWSKFPQYLLTASIATVAFSVSVLLPSTPDRGWISTAAAFLAVAAAVFAGGSMVCAYLAFEIGARLHLAPALAQFSLKDPVSRRGRVRPLSIAAWRLMFGALVLLLLAVAGVAATVV